MPGQLHLNTSHGFWAIITVVAVVVVTKCVTYFSVFPLASSMCCFPSLPLLFYFSWFPLLCRFHSSFFHLFLIIILYIYIWLLKYNICSSSFGLCTLILIFSSGFFPNNFRFTFLSFFRFV